MNISKPWFQLSPNEWHNKWWKITDIIDETLKPDEFDIECYFIIQDCNMNGNFWHFSCWYFNCPNRYSWTVYESDWFLNKKLSDIFEGDTVYLLDNIGIKYKAYNSPHVFDEQKKFCKILVRM
jgi:hypothetical protein